MVIHVVAPGETVVSIAQLYGVTAEDIEWLNQLLYPYEVVVGQALLIDNGAYTGERPPIYVDGFAYPFISRWVLNHTLSYLSYLAVFSYGFTAEGTLLPPLLDDTFMIRMAYNQDAPVRICAGGEACRPTIPVLTLTPFGLDGRFNNELIHALIINDAAMDNLIGQLLQKMDEKGFQAVEIDFEFILEEDRDLFSAFVRRVRDAMQQAGYQTFVDLAPKTSADQPGLLYQGKDYRALGEAADAVLLMTYEWGYKYGPPLAVAPINMVRRVVEYALSEIPAEKIRLGIPNYGYDWPLPYERNVTVAVTLGNVEAVQQAVDYQAEIFYDEEAQSPYYYYNAADGIRHVVWYEDVRSLEQKFSLIKEYGLRGAGYWTVMQWFRANWSLLADRFTIL